MMGYNIQFKGANMENYPGEDCGWPYQTSGVN